MESGQKRKRESDFPRVTYHVDASERSFDRLFKEKSLKEMKEVARRKLNLPFDTPVAFAQLRDGKTIDLEDDDDFDAFSSVAQSRASMDVKVTVGSPGTQTIRPSNSAPMTPSRKKKKRKLDLPVNELLSVGDRQPTNGEQNTPRVENHETDKGKTKVSFGESFEGNRNLSTPAEPRNKKKRKNKASDLSIPSATPATLNNSNLMETTDLTPLGHPVSLKFSGPKLPMTRSEASTVATEEQAPGKSKKARRKKKPVDQGAETSIVEKLLPVSAPPTESKPKKRSKSKSTADSKVTSIGEQPADVTSTISAAIEQPVHRPVEQTERRTKAHKQRSTIEGKSDIAQVPANSIEDGKYTNSIDNQNGQKSPKETYTKNVTRHEDNGESSGSARTRKSKLKRRLSTSEELKAVNADIKAAVARILAAKRALLGSSTADSTRIEGVERPGDEVISNEVPSMSPLTKLPKLSQVQELSTSSRNPEPGSPSRSSAETACPLCSLSPLHVRERCPVVLGGSKSLENRLAEIQADSTLRKSYPKLIDELKDLVVAAQKTREKDGPVHSDGRHSPSPSHHSLRAASLTIPSPSYVSAEATNRSSDVQNRNEHSESDDSDSSSDGDTSEDDGRTEPALLPIPPNASLDAVDLDDLIRGPKLPFSAINISSPDSSDEAEDQVLEEDEEDGKAKRRQSPDSSEVEDSDPEDHPSNAEPSLDDDQHSYAHAEPHVGLLPGLVVDPVSFQAVDKLGESQEVDRSADAAFGIALAADTEIFKLADHPPVTESTPKPTKNAPLSMTSSSEEMQVVPARDVSPIQIPTPTQTIAESSDSVPDNVNGNQDVPTSPEMTQKARLRKGDKSSNSSSTVTPAPRRKSRSRCAEPVQASQDSIARRTRTALRTQSLSSMTPPSLPAKMGNKSRVIRPANLIENHAPASSNPMSLNTWEILKPSSPIPEMDSTIMVDELRSSSPDSRMDVDVMKGPEVVTSVCDLHGHASSKDPLFILTESQPPFPYSQWNSIPPGENPGDENDPISNDSDDEIEVEASIKSQSQSRSSGVLKYRRLTDIARQHALFSTPANLRPALFPSPSQKMDIYGRSGHEEVESESDSDSDDSDNEGQSHIPESRRAGATRSKSQRKR